MTTMKIGSDFDGKESAAADKPEEKKRSVPPGFRWLYGLQFGHNYNASGWAMDGSARGFVINSNVYLGIYGFPILDTDMLLFLLFSTPIIFPIILMLYRGRNCRDGYGRSWM
mmetsp:Transcript_41967/g.98338  ORF Transcript_41967/g.98338 Transcript_41967/m.98338 type:complete len:112 (-) Transcript_41967:1436-1771(-)